MPDERVHLDEVDDALEVGLGADRQLHDRGLDAEALVQRVDAEIEVGADLIHLVDEDQTRNVVLVGLAPDRLGLRLDALVAVEQRDGAVEHAQRALDFDGEVHVAGRVDDVEAVHAPVAALPEGRGRSGRDRDAALLLLLHPVHGRGAVMDFADLVGLAGVVEHALGGRGLAGIDVGHDAEITVFVDRVFAGHCLRPVTSGSARRRGWRPPSGACLRVS